METPTRLTVEAVKQRVDHGERMLFVDARNPRAWSEAKTTLPGAVRVPADQVEQHLASIPHDRSVITYGT